MARRLRLQYAGAIYHVMNCGDRREDIFLEEQDRLCFVESLGLRRGWCLGSEEFKREMLQRMEGQFGESHSGELRQESADARAGRILAEELKRLGWKATELARRRKSDPDKLAIAARLRRERALSIKSIAGRVQLGSSKSANANLHSWMKAHPEGPVTPVRTEPETRKAKTRPKGAAHDYLFPLPALCHER